MCGNGRNGPNMRTTGLTTATKAGTTTTTPRRRYFPRGTPTTPPYVTTCRAADVISNTPMDLSAHMTPMPHLLLYPGMAMTSLFYHEIQNTHRSPVHLNTLELPRPRAKLRAQAWSRTQQQGLVWCGSTEDSTAACQERTRRLQRSATRGV